MSSPDKEKKRVTSWTFDEACKKMEWTALPKFDILSVSSSNDTKVENISDDTDLVVVGFIDNQVPENLSSLDKSLDSALTHLLKEQSSSSQKSGGSVPVGTSLPSFRKVGKDGNFIRYSLLSLQSKDFSQVNASKIGASLAKLCHEEKKVSKCSVYFPADFQLSDERMRDISCAFYSSLYSDNRYRTGNNIKLLAPSLTSVTMFVSGSETESLSKAITDGYSFAKGIFMAKDIVNAPHNVLNSLSLAETAKRIAESSGGTLECEILDKDDCERLGMGAYLAVARGSETPPQFIHMTYRPKGEVKCKVGVVGKGLLFDTGGYNIKTSGMELMKFDCGGAAATLGGARAIADLAPEGVEAHFISAACENMISDRAYVPSDILTASNGKTIEVLNTDAEGRLTLADALCYADKELKCDQIIELSTLTGACMVSLGMKIAGVWTCSDALASDLAEVSTTIGEKTWRMPMEMEYNEHLKSKIADVQNIGTRYGGAIQAALFLQNFVEEDKPFAHIDIAGPVWDDKSGATGYGAKTVAEWIRRQGN